MARAGSGHSLLARPGINCWRVGRARRAAFLIDAKSYFDALAATLERARRSIFILGWDIHSRLRLHPDRPARADDELGALLDAIARRNPRVRVRILDWDFTFLLTSEREFAPWLNLDWQSNERISLRLDSRHPIGACHHQKVVVVDDAVAFVGGLDLTARRWDTPEHRVDDPRRVDPSGKSYEPFHDVQLAVDGEAARLLGVLARERWRRATGALLREAATRSARDPWPPALVADLENVPVAIARTEPPYGARAGVREIERLYVDSIASARRSIYIENQYLSSRAIGDALCASLAAPHGPEIVVVAPRECSGWLEQNSMGLLRHRLTRRLCAADHAGRFRLLHPRLPGDGARLNVHAKLMIVDDRIAHVGSANLSNRSMGFDTECDAHLEATGDPALERGIAGVRARLLAEHLGVTPGRIESALAKSGSLLAVIDRFRGGERSLEPLDVEVAEWIDAVVPERLLTDPERPIKSLAFIEAWTPELFRDPHRRTALPLFAGLGALLVAVQALGSRWELARPLAAMAIGGVVGVAGLQRWLSRPSRQEERCERSIDS